MKTLLTWVTTLILFLGLIQPVDARKKEKYKYKEARNYEVVMLGVGSDGTKVFKIYATDKNVERAIALAKMAAEERPSPTTICTLGGFGTAALIFF